MAHGAPMEFIETSVFVSSARSLLTETDLIDLQSVLMLRPEAGAIMPGTGGCRKTALGSARAR